jgi:hypothetical protein
MFFADPVAAFANVGRALRPAGRLAFLCMTEFAGTDLGAVFGAMAPYLPRPTGPERSGPTSFADPEYTRFVLAGAGFQDITCTHVEADQIWGRDVADATEFITGWGPSGTTWSRPAPTPRPTLGTPSLPRCAPLPSPVLFACAARRGSSRLSHPRRPDATDRPRHHRVSARLTTMRPDVTEKSGGPAPQRRRAQPARAFDRHSRTHDV